MENWQRLKKAWRDYKAEVRLSLVQRLLDLAIRVAPRNRAETVILCNGVIGILEGFSSCLDAEIAARRTPATEGERRWMTRQD